jgi:hypothetical protein
MAELPESSESQESPKRRTRSHKQEIKSGASDVPTTRWNAEMARGKATIPPMGIRGSTGQLLAIPKRLGQLFRSLAMRVPLLPFVEMILISFW